MITYCSAQVTRSKK